MTKDTPSSILKKYWGFDSFRPKQEEIIQSAIAKKDTLALLPTGGGKSICFQVPALCQEGICIVVSPLIALMKDQVQNLQKRNIPAIAIYSGMHYKDIDRSFDNCIYGNIKLLYLSPERLSTEIAIERIKKMNVNLLAIDEAHCISQWGYDFRPSYLQINEIRALLPNTPVMALTATATKEVVKDIQDKLAFENGQVFQNSFHRSNLSYSVLYEEGKYNKMLDILQKIKGAGIVYVRSRKKAKVIADFLQKKNISADYYHAGLGTELRAVKQDNWLSNKTRIIVSTNAFGMGIDKPDVRVVVHIDLPDNLEAYFQEAGRAGRDGKKSYAVLLYNQADRINLERHFELSFPSMSEIRRVYQALGSYFQLATGGGEGLSFDFNIATFVQKFQLDIVKTYHCLKILEQAGWIVMTDSVFIPSTIRFTLSREEMYDYQLRNPKKDRIIKAILRSYQGAVNNFVNIREQKIAQSLKTDLGVLIKALELMQQDGILDYRRQRDSPQLIFLEQRIDAQDLMIDTKLYDFRKNRQLERMKKVIAYAEDPICRSQQLLRYFGEEAKSCGICDVCTGRTKTELSNEDFDRYKTKIEQLLMEHPLTMKELVQSFAAKRENQILKAIEYLLDEEFLLLEGDKLSWVAKS